MKKLISCEYNFDNCCVELKFTDASYTGSMIHNYYLYEENGQMAMIPWDYNLAFGTFQGGNAQSTVNTPIDSSVDGGSSEDRPQSCRPR